MQQEELHIGELHDKPFPETQNYLMVNTCGAQRLGGKAYRVIREKGRKDFHILYAESGSCCVYYEGAYRELFKGQYVLYAPHQRQEYSFPEHTSSVTYWVHFHGTHARNILKDCNLKSGIHTAHAPHEAEKAFRRLAHALHPASDTGENKKNGLLLSLLCALAEPDDCVNVPETVQTAVHYLQTNFTEHIETTTLASMCNLSSDRFLHVFKAHIGTSPHQYLLMLRIERAKELLLSRELSVSDVASMVGFEDAFYFSRIFKKITGFSPRDFRKHIKM